MVCSKEVARVLSTSTLVDYGFTPESFSKRLYNSKFAFMLDIFTSCYIIDESFAGEFGDTVLIGGTDGLNSTAPNNPYIASFRVINIK